MQGNISKSINDLSLRDVYRMNYLLSGMALTISFSYLLLDNYKLPYIGFKSGIYILLTGYCHAIILRFCATRYSERQLVFKAVRYTAGFVCGIILYFSSWFAFNLLTGQAPHLHELRWIAIYTIIAFFLNFIIFILHDFAIIRRAKIQGDHENYRLQIRNTEAENLLLKQQIHPHFLFNALNILKILYKNDHDMGEQYLRRLSEFLRISVSHNKTNTATLEEELVISENYLEMQKMRFNMSLDWEIHIENRNNLTKELPSFSLQPLLENAIKHNAFTLEAPLKIQILQYADLVEISNNINKKRYTEDSPKSGLSNLAERYRLLTGNEILVTDNGATFSVSLKLISP